MPQPALTTEEVGEVTLLRLEGEYDVANVAELRDALGGLAASGRPLVVVLTMASFIDSTILGVLLGALRRAKEERRGFVFALEPDASSGAIDRLLEMSGLLRIFPVYSSIDEATTAAAGGANTPPTV
jgi:anti-sigma B factor antagonist